MKANELRIGNWCSDNAYEDFKINSNHLGYLEKREDIMRIHPIPLTEQWLLDFGFEKKDIIKWNGNVYDYQPKDVFTEQIDFVKGDFIYRFETFTYSSGFEKGAEIHFCEWFPKVYHHINCPKIEHVHQLQNLYFALTGDELEVK